MEYQLKIYPFLRRSELIVYSNSIGIISNVRAFITQLNSFFSSNKNVTDKTTFDLEKLHDTYKDNFNSLIALYGYDKSRFYLLIDENTTPKSFMDYFKEQWI
ncbi:hypothetical protein [Sediminicola arcticus]|jgi:hypothetical protein|uniref:Uncharacterized protein n=1 Tax=Sediminicola arcticus TaxID=1574308 RepID=A0ABV2SV38_9FLAO